MCECGCKNQTNQTEKVYLHKQIIIQNIPTAQTNIDNRKMVDYYYNSQ